MSQEIHPAFRQVDDQLAAEAFSEPLTRMDDFFAQRIGSLSVPAPSPDSVAAICSAYVDNNEQVAFGFAIHPQNNRPYTTTHVFIRGYQSSVPGMQREALGRSNLRVLAESGDMARIATEQARTQRLRTLAAFLLFVPSSEGGNQGMVTIPKQIVTEGGAQVSGVQQVPEGKAGEMMQSRIRRIGFLIGALQLPTMKQLGQLIGQYPSIAGYTDLSRHERRERMQQEGNGMRQKSKR